MLYPNMDLVMETRSLVCFFGYENHYELTLLHSEQTKLNRVLAVLSIIGLKICFFAISSISSKTSFLNFA